MKPHIFLLVVVFMQLVTMSVAFLSQSSAKNFLLNSNIRGNKVFALSKFVSSENGNAVNINGKTVSADTLKGLELTNIDGKRISVGSLTDAWLSESSRLRENQIAGPVFISIGDPEKISLFLEKNPNVPRNMLLVDGYDFAAYNAMGYGKLLEDKSKTILGGASLKLPQFGFGKWKDYISTVTKLAPIPKGSKATTFPEGVLRLGGTLALNGNRIVYSYEDGVPGDHPNPIDVIRSLSK